MGRLNNHRQICLPCYNHGLTIHEYEGEARPEQLWGLQVAVIDIQGILHWQYLMYIVNSITVKV